MAWWEIFSAAKPAVEALGGAAKFIGERVLPPKKMGEAERIDKVATLFKISEDSTSDAREMFMTELRTQKQPWLIKVMNGFVRPFGGIGALSTEFFVIWGQNMAKWIGFEFVPITLTLEQHLFLGAIVAFYFGTRTREVIRGMTVKR